MLTRLRQWWRAFLDRQAPVMEECTRCHGWFTLPYIRHVDARLGNGAAIHVPVCLDCIGVRRRDPARGNEFRASTVGRR